MFERARASEFVSASVRRLLAEGTGANAPAQPVDPPPGSRPGRRASKEAKPDLRYRLALLLAPQPSAER